MGNRLKYLKGALTDDLAAVGQLGIRLPNVATASLATPATGNKGALVFDITSGTVKYSTGAAWSNVATAGAITDLDTAFDGGNTIDGSITGTRFQVGDGVVYGEIWGDGTDVNLTTSGGDLLITPAGGDVTVTGNVAISGSLSAAAVNFTGAFNVGVDGTGQTMYWYTDTLGDYIKWDDANKTMIWEDTKAQFNDSDEVHFGTGSGVGTGDYKIYGINTDWYMTPTADVASQTLHLGSNTNDMNVVWYGDTAGAEVTFTSASDIVIFDGIDLRLNDDDFIVFGDDADWSIEHDSGTNNLVILPGADVADQAVIFGSATVDCDVIFNGDTSGDYAKWDSSADQLVMVDADIVMTETATDEESIDITSAHTSVSAVEINSSGVIADNKASLSLIATGNIASGGNVLRLEYSTGTPNAGAILAEMSATGKDLRGLFFDCDGATDTVYQFHGGGNIGATKAVLAVTADGTPAAGSTIAAVNFTGTATNSPNLLSLSGVGKNVSGLAVVCDADGTVANHLILMDSKDATPGVVIFSLAESAAPTAADALVMWDYMGKDSAANDTRYARFQASLLEPTDGQEDGEFIYSVAADNGTLTQALVIGPQLNSANTGISVGSGAGAAAITSEGAFDLILQTNYGTNSSTFTITDAANGNITADIDGTGSFVVTNNDAGILGPVVSLFHDSASPANSDEIGYVNFLGRDDGANVLNYGRITCQITDVGAATPDADLIFSVFKAGALTPLLQLDSDVNGVVVGDAAATGVVASAGSQNLNLVTGGGNKSVVLDPDGTGTIVPVNRTLANADNTLMAPVMMRFVVAAGGAQDVAIYNADAPYNFQITGVMIDVDTADAGETVQLRTATGGGGSAVTSTMSVNATGMIPTASLDNNSIAAGGSLFVRHSAAAPTSDVAIIITGFIYSV